MPTGIAVADDRQQISESAIDNIDVWDGAPRGWAKANPASFHTVEAQQQCCRMLRHGMR